MLGYRFSYVVALFSSVVWLAVLSLVYCCLWFAIFVVFFVWLLDFGRFVLVGYGLLVYLVLLCVLLFGLAFCCCVGIVAITVGCFGLVYVLVIVLFVV